MFIGKNTETLKHYEKGINFSFEKNKINFFISGAKKIKYKQYPNLKYIFRVGVGRDNILDKDLNRYKIKLFLPSSRTKKILYEETANFTCYLILKLMFLKVGNTLNWEKYSRIDLNNKNLLIIGMGNIGSRVYKKMKNFMKINFFDIKKKYNKNLISKLKKADCITFHIPANLRNNNFMNEKKLKLLKKNCVIINTARANIFNESVLYKFLKDNRNILAAFDVFWKEPYKGKLSKLKNFFMSPHVASNSNGFIENCRKDIDMIISKINNKSK